MPGQPRREDARDQEDDAERLDRQMLELLNELRVAMPGVQVLFGFLLTVPFQSRFTEITRFQEYTYFVTLLLAASATAFFIGPMAFHRMTFRERQKPKIIEIGHRRAVLGLVALGLAMTGAVMLITDLLFRTATVVAVVAGMAVLFAWLWFVSGAVRRVRSEPAW